MSKKHDPRNNNSCFSSFVSHFDVFWPMGSLSFWPPWSIFVLLEQLPWLPRWVQARGRWCTAVWPCNSTHLLPNSLLSLWLWPMAIVLSKFLMVEEVQAVLLSAMVGKEKKEQKVDVWKSNRERMSWKEWKTVGLLWEQKLYIDFYSCCLTQ